ncbi:MAG: type II toxin-antitoxin system VapC family toxin [Candidatus Korarchaeota archaeon]|nr:type II toxin-antitoxin system VapC family toxin [Candidatus Korarchaeota archaeon]
MSVVDASIVARFVLGEEGWRSLADHLRSAVTVDHVVKEVANSVWKALRRGLIGESDAERKFQALTALSRRT